MDDDVEGECDSAHEEDGVPRVHCSLSSLRTPGSPCTPVRAQHALSSSSSSLFSHSLEPRLFLTQPSAHDATPVALLAGLHVLVPTAGPPQRTAATLPFVLVSCPPHQAAGHSPGIVLASGAAVCSRCFPPPFCCVGSQLTCAPVLCAVSTSSGSSPPPLWGAAAAGAAAGCLPPAACDGSCCLGPRRPAPLPALEVATCGRLCRG